MLSDSGGRKLMSFFQMLHTSVPRFYISGYFTYKLVERKPCGRTGQRHCCYHQSGQKP